MKPEELERSFACGEPILERGARTRELYIVRSGRVRIDAGGGEPSRHLVGGAVFGELSAILGEPSPYAARADDTAVVLVLDLPLLNRMCRESPDFSMRMMRHLALAWSDTLTRTPSPDVGVDGQSLALLAGAILRRSAHGEAGAVSGNLEELAGEAGLGMLVAHRALHEFLERGWVQLADDVLSITAPTALHDLLE